MKFKYNVDDILIRVKGFDSFPFPYTIKIIESYKNPYFGNCYTYSYGDEGPCCGSERHILKRYRYPTDRERKLLQLRFIK